MAHAAVGELFRVDLVSRHQCFAEDGLVRRAPVQVEYFVTGPDEFFRLAMAIEAPLHVERVRFPGKRHLIQLPVARGAADAMAHVDAVIEEDKIRRLIHPIPAQWLIVGQAVADRREHRGIFPDLRMAGHAGLG